MVAKRRDGGDCLNGRTGKSTYHMPSDTECCSPFVCHARFNIAAVQAGIRAVPAFVVYLRDMSALFPFLPTEGFTLGQDSTCDSLFSLQPPALQSSCWRASRVNPLVGGLNEAFCRPRLALQCPLIITCGVRYHTLRHNESSSIDDTSLPC